MLGLTSIQYEYILCEHFSREQTDVTSLVVFKCYFSFTVQFAAYAQFSDVPCLQAALIHDQDRNSKNLGLQFFIFIELSVSYYTLIKKKIKYKEIQSGAVAKSYTLLICAWSISDILIHLVQT